jgi:hypothetical protein
VPSTTPPTSPAAAVATPVTTATFDDPFDLAFCALLPDDRAEELRLRDEAPEERRLDAPEERRLDALALFGLLREAADLLFEPLRLLFEPLRLLLLEEALRLFALEPLRLFGVLACAIAPP